MALHLAFDRGTIRVDGDCPGGIASFGDELVRFDDRTGFHRAAAHRYAALRDECLRRGVAVDDPIATAAFELAQSAIAPVLAPTLRPYQAQALAAFETFGRRGVVALPTGAGKTRVACAAIARAQTSALILVPTRVLLEQWLSTLTPIFGAPIGVVGDGSKQIAPVTVMTFESAYRCLDRFGHRFGMLVVDEAHHFGGGLRAEALEMCTAPIRLGLTATPPAPGTAGSARLRDLIGPVVFELEIADLAGHDLAELEIMRIHVALNAVEQEAYERDIERFLMLRRDVLRVNPDSDWVTCLKAIARTPGGSEAIAGMLRATALASFPSAKRTAVRELLARHRADRTLLFTATADDAYAIGAEALVPVITADVARAEREAILSAFREHRVRAICSARVLNEGIDVPDANVAIIVAGALGAREHVQRVGRILRPRAGKRAIAYELVTMDTLDEARTRAKRRGLAPARSALHREP